MKIDTQYLVAGIAAVVVVLGGLAYWLLSGSSNPTDQVAAEINSGTCKPIETVAITPDDFTFGKADAPLTIVEYASQTCSHCADFRREVFPKLEENYIKTGKLRFVFREFQRNRIDLAASVLGRCLGRDAFIPFTDMLFENQATWMMREDQDIIAGLRDMTRRAGMSNQDFEACMKKEAEAKRLSDIRDKAMKDYCLEATPTLILNGKKLGSEGTSYEGLDGLLTAELKKLGKAAPAAATTETPAASTDVPKPPADGTAPADSAAPAPPAAPAPAASTAPATKPADTPKPSTPATEPKPNP